MSKRNSKKVQIVNESILNIGLDIGYGVVKAVTADDVVTFPSVAGHARELKFMAKESTAKHPGDQIMDDEGEWFVGDLALMQIRPGELLRLRGRTANEAELGNVFRTRLAKAAIGKLLPGRNSGEVVHIRIATGLPVDHMPDAQELKDALLGQHRIITDQTDIIANVTEVMVMPQPYGTIYRNMLMPNGEINECHNYARTGVVDIGTYTIDLALDDDGEYVDVESGSVESGVFTAQERISSMLEREYRQKMPYKVIEGVLRNGCFKAQGQPVDYSEEVTEALAPLRDATLNLMNDKWQRGTTVDVIYLAGGGAELVHRMVQAAYPQTVLVDNAQLSNAQGYLNYANFAQRD